MPSISVVATDTVEQIAGGGSVTLGSTDLDLGNDGGSESVTGLRFVSCAIPVGATISSAEIVYTARNADSSSLDLKTYGIDEDSPAAFSTSSPNRPEDKTKTSASNDWNSVPAWSSGESGADTTNTGLASIVQEIVDRAGWASGNTIGFIVELNNSTTGTRGAKSDNHADGATEAPVLNVTYTTGGGGGGGSPSYAVGSDVITGKPRAISRTIVRYPGANADDVAEDASGNIDLTAFDMPSSGLLGLRLSGIDVPSGADIGTASIVFRYNNGVSGTGSYRISVEASDNAAIYTTATDDVSGRSYGSSVTWSVDLSVGGFAAEHETPSLASLVQEVIDRPGWVKGGAIAFKIEKLSGGGQFNPLDTHELASIAYGPAEWLPKLEFTYTSNLILGDECVDNVGWRLKFTPLDPSDGSTEERTYSNRRLDDAVEARLKQGFSIKRSVYDGSRPHAERGASRLGLIKLTNSDGALDDLQDRVLEGQPIVLEKVDMETGASVTRFSGTMGRPTHRGDVMTLKLNDQAGVLDTPAQVTYMHKSAFAGLRGNLAPVLLGRVRKIPAIHINPYRYVLSDITHDVKVNAVWHGLRTTNYSVTEWSNPELPAPDREDNTITLTFKPDKEIRVDAEMVSPYRNTVGGCIQQLLDDRLPDLPRDSASFAQLDIDAPYPAGFWVYNNQTIAEVMDVLLMSVGAFWTFNRLGQLSVCQIRAASEGDVEAVIDDGSILAGSLELVERRGAYTHWSVGHSANETTLTVSDNESMREFIAGEVGSDRTYSTMDDSVIGSRWPRKAYQVDGYLSSSEGAGIEAVRRMKLWGGPTRFLRLTVKTADTGLELCSVVEVYSARLGLSGGKKFRVIGMEENESTNRTRLELWDGVDQSLDSRYEASASYLLSDPEFLITSGLPTTNNKFITLSCWVKWREAPGHREQIFAVRQSTDERIKLLVYANGEIEFIARDSSNVEVIRVSWYLDTPIHLLGWLHLYLAVNGNSDTTCSLWVNGSEITDREDTTYDTATAWDWSGTSMAVFCEPEAGNGADGMQIQDLWVDNSYDGDLITEFMDPNNRPQDLSSNGSGPTGSSPLICIRTPISTGSTVTNGGTAGNATRTGGSVVTLTEDTPTKTGV